MKSYIKKLIKEAFESKKVKRLSYDEGTHYIGGVLVHCIMIIGKTYGVDRAIIMLDSIRNDLVEMKKLEALSNGKE